MSTLETNLIQPSSGTTLTIGASGDTTNVVGTLQNNGAAVQGKFESQLLHVRDEKSASSDGGGTTGGSVMTRDLNTVVTNEITGASLGSNQITLPSGTYYIEAYAPGYACLKHRLFLYNTTDSSYTIMGSTGYARTSNAGTAFMVLFKVAVPLERSIVSPD